MPSKTSKRLLLVNVLGFFGYTSCLLQWLWAGVLLLPLVLRNENVKLFIMPKPSENPQRVVPSFDESSIALTVIAVIVTVIVMGLTLFVLLRLPIKFITASKRAVDTTAKAALPIVTHHKPLPAKKKQVISLQLRMYVKLLLCVIPVGLLAITFVVDVDLDRAIVVVVGLFLAIGSLVWFGLEYAAAKLLKVPLMKIA